MSVVAGETCSDNGKMPWKVAPVVENVGNPDIVLLFHKRVCCETPIAATV